MSTLETASSPQTVTTLLRQLTTQLSTLLRQELTLARLELYQSSTRLLWSAAVIVGGVALLYTAFLLLLVTAILGLAAFMPLWLAALSLSVATASVGGGLVLWSRASLKKTQLAPVRLPHSLRRDRDVLLRRAHS